MNKLNYNTLKETLNAEDSQYLVINHPKTGEPIKIKISTFIDIFGGDLVIGADNGLTVVGNNTELGGTLTQNTTINTSTFELIFSSLGAGSAGVDDILVINGSDQIRKISASSIAGWGLTGNAGTTAGTNFIGTTDAIDVVFKRDGTEKMRILSSSVTIGDNVGIGSPTINARLHVKGLGGGTYCAIFENSTPTEIINFKNNGEVNINGGNGFGATLSVKQLSGQDYAMDVYNNAQDKILLRLSDNGAAGQVILGNSIITINNYTGNIAIGGTPNTIRLKITQLGTDEIIALLPSGGTGGIYANASSNHPYFYLQNATATTKVLLNTNGNSYLNGGKVSMTALPTSNAGLSTGDLYVETAANILANGDLVVGWKA